MKKRKRCIVLSSSSIAGKFFKYVLIAAVGVFVARGSASATSEAKAIHCYVMNMEGNWKITEGLPPQALIISLQGLVNRTAPRLYLVYGKDYAFNNTKALLDFYHQQHHVDYTTLSSVTAALKQFHKYVKGYIVYDQKIRDSIVLSFTLAGIDDAVVVAPDQIPMMKKLGFRMLADFRGKFENMDTTQIYQWAYDHYWNKCKHNILVYMGGEEGKNMQPGVADYGIANRAFFFDLSTDPMTGGTQYLLAKKIYSEMKPFSFIFGWHSYMKDTEHSSVTLASHYALRVEGLNTLPNMSFNRWIKLPPGYRFHAHHSDLKNLKVEKKIYVSFIQSDELGLGAWLKPGRGEIPYGWEVPISYYQLAPAILQFYYEQATPNDFFIGALSGPSYTYPKAIPPKYLPTEIKMASKLMKKTDINMFDIFDASDSLTRDLPKRIVDAYFKYMPNAIGFVNGYGPAHTFAVRDGRVFMSFDYYLSPTRKLNEVVADLKELATLNPKRPYFLCFHVREYTDVKGIANIMKHLGPEFKVVPIDVFFKLASMDPTFKTQYQFTR